MHTQIAFLSVNDEGKLSDGSAINRNVLAGSLLQDLSIQISVSFYPKHDLWTAGSTHFLYGQGIYPIIIIVIVSLKRSMADVISTDKSLPSFVAAHQNTATVAIASLPEPLYQEERWDEEQRSVVSALVVGVDEPRSSGETGGMEQNQVEVKLDDAAVAQKADI